MSEMQAIEELRMRGLEIRYIERGILVYKPGHLAHLDWRAYYKETTGRGITTVEIDEIPIVEAPSAEAALKWIYGKAKEANDKITQWLERCQAQDRRLTAKGGRR